MTVVHTGAARTIVARVYEADLHTPTWARWRNWAQIPKRTVWLSIGQLKFLIAIAWLRRQQRSMGLNPTELEADMVLAVSESTEIQDALNSAFSQVELLGLALGRDLPEALKHHGAIASTQMLYRKIDGFSTYKYYDIKVVAKLLKAEYQQGVKVK